MDTPTNTASMTVSTLDAVMRVIDFVERQKQDRRSLLEELVTAVEENPDLSKRLWVALKLASGETR